MDVKSLISTIRATDGYFKDKVARTIDRHLTMRNWLIGYYIVEYEQKGQDRATYGKELLQNIAKELNQKGLSFRNLNLFRRFYLAYHIIGQAVSAYFDKEIVQTVSAQLDSVEIMQTSAQLKVISQTASDQSLNPNALSVEKLINNLSFSHFVELIKIEEPTKRTFYEIEAIKGVWSVRELKRQISTLNFERSAVSKDPTLMAATLSHLSEGLTPQQILKTPYVFDFLGLPDAVLGSESALETALVTELKSFILELGHGFCFEAQQKRIVIGGEYFFIDLVFYHRILKCHVIIELKIDEFTHANAGQLNTYIQYYKKNVQQENDNPPIGILLCTNRNEELVEYALGGMDENLFVSQYKTVLPSTEELKKFLQEEKKKL